MKPPYLSRSISVNLSYSLKTYRDLSTSGMSNHTMECEGHLLNSYFLVE